VLALGVAVLLVGAVLVPAGGFVAPVPPAGAVDVGGLADPAPVPLVPPPVVPPPAPLVPVVPVPVVPLPVEPPPVVPVPLVPVPLVPVPLVPVPLVPVPLVPVPVGVVADPEPLPSVVPESDPSSVDEPLPVGRCATASFAEIDAIIRASSSLNDFAVTICTAVR
jgi:hypothetical protein